MAQTSVDVVKGWYASTLQRLLKTVGALTDDQLHWRATPTAHSIAFQMWHVSRSEDYFHARLPQMTPALARKIGSAQQLWFSEGLTAKWGLNGAALGPGEMGFGMDDAVAASLKLPAKAIILDYAHRSFDAMRRALDAVDDADFMTVVTSDNPFENGPVGQSIVLHLGHNEWTLGAIASMRRAQGLARVEV